jgi:hypothetical protein
VSASGRNSRKAVESAENEHRRAFGTRRAVVKSDNTTDPTANGDRNVVLDGELHKILLAGIHAGWEGQRKAIERVRQIRPNLSAEEIDGCMQALAADGLPPWLKREFWTAEMDQVLVTGIRGGVSAERKAITKILKLHPELRPEVAWSRLRHLRRAKRENGHRGVPFEWTSEMDSILAAGLQSGEADLAVSRVQETTGYPRDAILRHAHKLGVDKQSVPLSRPWSDGEKRFLVESVQHLPVKTIARELHRTEKAVWRKVGELGLSAKCVEGYTVVEVMRMLHVWHARLKRWIGAGWVKVGRNGRITERSLRSFLHEHRDELNWDSFDSEARQWLLEFGIEAPPKAETVAKGA